MIKEYRMNIDEVLSEYNNETEYINYNIELNIRYYNEPGCSIGPAHIRTANGELRHIDNPAAELKDKLSTIYSSAYDEWRAELSSAEITDNDGLDITGYLYIMDSRYYVYGILLMNDKDAADSAFMYVLDQEW